MLKTLTFLKDHRCFKKDEAYEFRPLTLLVGDQGSGKSTLVSIIRHPKKFTELVKITSNKIALCSFDFEKDSPRGDSSLREDVSTLWQVNTRFISHGEMINQILNYLTQKKDTLFLMDEPDAALSIRSCHKLIEKINTAIANSCQIIASVHNPIIIGSVPEVLSLEHKKWMDSKEFIESQKI